MKHCLAKKQSLKDQFWERHNAFPYVVSSRWAIRGERELPFYAIAPTSFCWPTARVLSAGCLLRVSGRFLCLPVTVPLQSRVVFVFARYRFGLDLRGLPIFGRSASQGSALLACYSSRGKVAHSCRYGGQVFKRRSPGSAVQPLFVRVNLQLLNLTSVASDVGAGEPSGSKVQANSMLVCSYARVYRSARSI